MDKKEYEKKHRELLRQSLGECCVLLKSDGSFPLEKPGTVAAYGNGVRKTVKGGSGSGEVNSRSFVTVEEGLENAGFRIVSKNWLDQYDRLYLQARKDFLEKLKKEAAARKTNAIIYGMGKPMPEFDHDLKTDAEAEVALYVISRISGEGNDRSLQKGDFQLTDTEVRDILYLDEKFAKFLLVINSGAPLDLYPVRKVRNILLLSQLGSDTGNALADILLGKTCPSGKLAISWPFGRDLCQMMDLSDPDDTDYREGIYSGYRYYDARVADLPFCFGYGKSFTEFALEKKAVRLEQSKVTVDADITNTGKRPGKEVVQLYVSCPDAETDKPYQQLAAFIKTRELLPGEKEDLELCFDLRDLAFYEERNASFVLEKGEYVLRLGNSSRHTQPIAVLELSEDVITATHRNTGASTSFADWRPEKRKEERLPDDIERYPVSSAAFETETTIYGKEAEIDERLEKLNDEELILTNLGAFDPKAGILSFVGNAAKRVAGAAGETVGILDKRSLVVSDGPAGLRLVPLYYRKEERAYGIGSNGIPESVLEFLPGFVRSLMGHLGKQKIPQDVKVEEQYASALPIGSAIAQSWNLKLAEMYGDIVGKEMELFDVDLWLAPALNLQRSVFCGRNFEYFSEDPLLSGKMAAALTKGVQSHPGKGVTIKHFAANNQEYNRYGNSSNLSERALRELYLKGFEICVKEAKPLALMTSYNLINGEHTAQSRKLIEDVLRSEWGYQGIVMTDWIVGGGIMNRKEDKYAPIRPDLAAKNGNDLFMPGCKKDQKRIRKGLKEKTISRKDLLIHATRLLRLMEKVESAKKKDL